MDEDGDREPLITGKAALYALAAIIGGSGGSVIMDQINDPRPDPYYGRDGRRDKLEMYERLNKITEKLDGIREDIHELDIEQHNIRSRMDHLQSVIVDNTRHLEQHKDSKHPSKPH